MVEIKNVQIKKTGNSRCIIIPDDFFKHSDLDETKTYNVTFKESESHE